MDGWISLHRKLLDSLVFSNPNLLKVWVWCLLKATHTEHTQMVGLVKVELKKGDFVTGRFKGSEELNLNPSTFYKYLKVLEDEKQIKINSNNKFTVVTIVNWEVYQVEKIKSNNKITTKEQQNNTNNKGNKENKKEYIEFVDKMMLLYPGNKNKATRDKKLPTILKEHGEEQIIRCINRYKSTVVNKEKQFILQEGTFWNGRYIDYLDDNFESTTLQHNYYTGSERLL